VLATTSALAASAAVRDPERSGTLLQEA